MKVTLPILIQDQATSEMKQMPQTESCAFDKERFFLDGPVTDRLAVLDFDPGTGALSAGTRFLPDKATYEVDPSALESADFLRTNAFATVLKTIYMFEEGDTLGRRLQLGLRRSAAADRPGCRRVGERVLRARGPLPPVLLFQLPAAGQRDLHRASRTTSCRTRRATRSWTGSRPTSTTRSLRSRSRCTRGSPTWSRSSWPSATTRCARPCSTRPRARSRTSVRSARWPRSSGRRRASRAGCASSKNEKTLDPDDAENLVDVAEPHELCQVLTGALYTVMVKIHDSLKKQYAKEDGDERVLGLRQGALRRAPSASSGWSSGRSTTCRPGRSPSPTTRGRSSPPTRPPTRTREQGRDWMRKEFVRRAMATNLQALEVEEPFERPGGQRARPPDLHRQRLGRVRLREPKSRSCCGSRRTSPSAFGRAWTRSKTYYFHGGVKKAAIRECLFKVSWDAIEPNPAGSWFPEKRQITVGTTLAIDWETRKVRARLTSSGRQQRRAVTRCCRGSTARACSCRPRWRRRRTGRRSVRDPGRAGGRPDARARHGANPPHRRRYERQARVSACTTSASAMPCSSPSLTTGRRGTS